MTRKDIPNIISVLRMLLVVPIVYLLLIEAYQFALLLIVLAGLSDALDGFLAKRYDWSSPLGSFLDPLADKILLVCCFLVCVFTGLVPAWLFVLIVLRDLVVALGALLYHLAIEKFHGEPPFSSKLNTAFQIIYLVMLIASQGTIQLPNDWLEYAVYVVALTTAISGLEYVWTWGMRAWRIKIEGYRGQ